MDRSQIRAILGAIKDPDATIALGKQILKDATLEECSRVAGEHEKADEEIATCVRDKMIEHRVSRIDMGKLLVNMGIACWGSGVLLQRETASN